MSTVIVLLAVLAVAAAAYFAHGRGRDGFVVDVEAAASGFRQVGYVHNVGKDFRAPLLGRKSGGDGTWQYFIWTDGVRVDVRRGGVNCMTSGACFEIQTGDEVQAPEIGLHVVASMYGAPETRESAESRSRGQDLTGIPPAIAFAS